MKNRALQYPKWKLIVASSAALVQSPNWTSGNTVASTSKPSVSSPVRNAFSLLNTNSSSNISYLIITALNRLNVRKHVWPTLCYTLTWSHTAATSTSSVASTVRTQLNTDRIWSYTCANTVTIRRLCYILTDLRVLTPYSPCTARDEDQSRNHREQKRACKVTSTPETSNSIAEITYITTVRFCAFRKDYSVSAATSVDE